MAGRALTVLRLGTIGSRVLPLGPMVAVVQAAARRLGPRLMPDKAAILQRHLERVATTGPVPTAAGQAASGIASYARYWVEFFRLPGLGDTELDRGFSFVGYDRLEDVRAAGYGPLLVLPHLGGWEWAAAWLGRISEVEVTAVVERLEPEEVFTWFARLRRNLGITVIPLGAGATGALIAAVKRRSIVCLLADRDIGGNGVEVEFFGERTTVPIGPALLSRRTGAPLIPVAVFFRGRQRICVVGEPVWPAAERRPAGGTRAAAIAVTQEFVRSLEDLIRQAPEQWHLLEPNWPSDRDGLPLPA
ncbi:MAG: phosphatidylinositol mannoside acyltransferase [Actinomycetota bacterium]